MGQHKAAAGPIMEGVEYTAFAVYSKAAGKGSGAKFSVKFSHLSDKSKNHKPTVEIDIKEMGSGYEEKDELVLKCSHGSVTFEVPLIVDTVTIPRLTPIKLSRAHFTAPSVFPRLECCLTRHAGGWRRQEHVLVPRTLPRQRNWRLHRAQTRCPPDCLHVGHEQDADSEQRQDKEDEMDGLQCKDG